VIPDPSNIFAIKGYWLETGNGQRVVIRKGDIIHWRKPNPVYDPSTGGHLRGLPPLKVGRRTLQENIDATAAMSRMFKNDGAKGVLIGKNVNWFQLTEDQRQQLMDMVDNRINNHDVKGAVGLMGGDWNYQDISKASVDEVLLNGKKFTWQELCFLLKVPYQLFQTDTTFNNVEQSQKNWVSNTVLPQCRNFDVKLTERLCKAFGLFGKVVIWSDPSSLPEFQKDIAAMITAFNLAWYISPNKRLTALGFDPEPNPLFNEPWIPQGYSPLSDIQNEINFNQQNQQQANDGIEY
jgi:phage portal protein BeeE